MTTDRRKPCRYGHFDCIGLASRDDRCWSDPSRCYDRKGRQYHIYESGNDCTRCGKPFGRGGAAEGYDGRELAFRY